MGQSNNFSMSVSSINSNFSTSSLTSTSAKTIKSSSEYRALRQQLFQLQSSHNSLKLVHEREMILASSQKFQLQEQVQKLQKELDEIKKDQVYILNSEKETLNELEKVKIEKEQVEKSLKSEIVQLNEELQSSKEAIYNSESELTKLKLQNMEKAVIGYDEEFVTGILAEWKERVINLNEQKNSLEEQLESLESLKSTCNTHSFHNHHRDDPEELRQKILSTFVSLESAQHTLAQRRAEAERLVARIGNVKILEEKYRDAQIKIKRMENELNRKENIEHDSPSPSPTTPSLASASSSSASDLKLIQLTQELGSLKESLALANLNYSSLQSELATSKSSQDSLQVQLDESSRTIAKLKNSLKVKDSSIASLKEQLDSTVNLLTETLKKKNK
jgi:chromosome segregation ATPase